MMGSRREEEKIPFNDQVTETYSATPEDFPTKPIRGNDKPLWTATCNPYWSVLPVLLVVLAHNFTCSSVAPVFSLYGNQPHVNWSRTFTGSVIGSFDSGNVISSIVIGCFLTHTMQGRLVDWLIGATFVSGCISLVFGLCIESVRPDIIVPICIVLRHVEGACFSVSWVSSMSLVIGRFGDHSISTSFAVVNSAAVTGFMIGPALGTGVLALTMNFMYPFLVTGGYTLLSALVLLVFRRSQNVEPEDGYTILQANPDYLAEGSKLQFLKDVMRKTPMVVYLLILPVPCLLIGCYEVSISPYFAAPYSLVIVSVIWFTTTGVYTATSLVCGVLYDRGYYHIILLSSALLVVGAGGLWLPLPFIVQIFLLFGIPLGCASLIAPIYRFIRFAILDVRQVENVDLMVSAIINSIYSVSRGSGAFVFGGVMLDLLGFHASWAIITLLGVEAFCLCCYLWLANVLTRLKYLTTDRGGQQI